MEQCLTWGIWLMWREILPTGAFNPLRWRAVQNAAALRWNQALCEGEASGAHRSEEYTHAPHCGRPGITWYRWCRNQGILAQYEGWSAFTGTRRSLWVAYGQDTPNSLLTGDQGNDSCKSSFFPPSSHSILVKSAMLLPLYLSLIVMI